jgi:hypothetical protein
MSLFWLWVSAGCAASALMGFSMVRLGARQFGKDNWQVPGAQQTPEPPATGLSELLAVAPEVLERPARSAMPPAKSRTAAPKPATPARRGRSRPAESRPKQTSRKRAQPKPEPASAPPAPTAPKPDPEQLALWTRQIKAGKRQMSVATDGCRVTWNRTCKHGHPSWLVHLGYLRRSHLQRHTPR